MGEQMTDQTCCPEKAPQLGDVYVCETCKMTITVTKGCPAMNADPKCCCFGCCGKPLTCVNSR